MTELCILQVKVPILIRRQMDINDKLSHSPDVTSCKQFLL